MGQIRSTFLIKDNKILHEWRNVRVKEHAKEVLNFLKSKFIKINQESSYNALFQLHQIVLQFF